MSDYVSCSSTFEQLANELLLIIFEYLHLKFVYNGFFDFNRRFNSLLASNLLPSNKQCKKVNLHTLPHLKYLHVQNDSCSESKNNFYFNPCNISHLHSICIRNSSCGIRWSKNDSFLYALRSLTITTEAVHNVYLQILVGCPNLIRLQIEVWSNYDHQMQRNPISHLNLRRLIINPSKDLSGKMLEFMLSNVPNLSHLTAIGVVIDRQYDTLATILNRYTVHLKVLDIILIPSCGGDEHFRRRIQQTHPLFVDVQWFYPACCIRRPTMRISSKTICR